MVGAISGVADADDNAAAVGDVAESGSVAEGGSVFADTVETGASMVGAGLGNPRCGASQTIAPPSAVAAAPVQPLTVA
eukprot:CAMPEP_0182583032 /NCGR_PEP_ID=MMETSP1324-20130603/54108_1 /TAXON_ID=236786 /ORGANISM="Florenciella sp., Strain RCC1587" /LENGTH=77 /DNA_ID=CAMNT_0024799557 /DNA_START=44 /DNA_END=277 /DNA_ORIENTATION=+